MALSPFAALPVRARVAAAGAEAAVAAPTMMVREMAGATEAMYQQSLRAVPEGMVAATMGAGIMAAKPAAAAIKAVRSKMKRERDANWPRSEQYLYLVRLRPSWAT